MNRRLLGICAFLTLVAVSVAGYALQASAASRKSTGAPPTLQSLNARIAVLETEVKQLRRDEFQNQIDALRKDVLVLCGESATTCP